MDSVCVDEETAAALLGGRLSADDARRIEEHADGCSSCREFISALAAVAAPSTPRLPSSRGSPASADVARADEVSPLAPTGVDAPRANSVPILARGDKLGRYVVLERIGVGGMGVVYAAYDPDLDRRVAIKLLRGLRAPAEIARARLMREAQALARLNDPHVVAVHDIGTFADQVFISMEFVDGGTVTQWLKLQRPWRDVLALYLLAARGLAAAHRAGLVHRDFKPDNVLVGKDGRPRVTDFGLARDLGRSDGPDAQSPSSSSSSSSPSPGALPLTQDGAVIGTPAYMAPEQHDGRPADARSDQYSFCVALYEGLFGARPTPDAVEAPRAGATRVPARIRRILARGLSRDAAARYPTMDALIAELSFDPAARLRRRALAAGLVAVAAAAVAVPLAITHRQGRLCSGGAARFAAVWTPARKAEIRAAILGTPVSWAAGAADQVVDTIDRYGRDWAAMYTDACEANRVRGVETDNVLELRMGCLQSQLDDVNALAGALAHTDKARVGRVIQAARGLTPVDRCADVVTLSAPPPPAPAQRAAVEKLRQRAPSANALYATGDWAEAQKQADALVAEARPVGYAPVTADALLLQAQIAGRRSDFTVAEKSFFDAAVTAESAGADDVAALAWTRLFGAQSDAGHFDDAARTLALAEATIGRMRGRHREIAGRLYRYKSDYERLLGHYPVSIADALKSLEESEAALGPTHLDTGFALGAVGTAYGSAENHQKALEYHERANRIIFAVYPPGHPQRDGFLTNLAADYANVGRWDDSINVLLELERAMQARSGKPTMELAYLYVGLADCMHHLQKFDKALDYAKKSLAVRESLAGPNFPDNALSLEYMSQEELALHHPKEALADAERAVAISDAPKPPAQSIVQALVFAGDAAAPLGARDKAKAYYTRAVAIAVAQKQPTIKFVGASFGLAKLAWAAGDRVRARADVEAALAALPDEPANAQALDELRGWLGAHR
jgi:eukaryotic-like serine/threonine-protein kinase